MGIKITLLLSLPLLAACAHATVLPSAIIDTPMPSLTQNPSSTSPGQYFSATPSISPEATNLISDPALAGGWTDQPHLLTVTPPIPKYICPWLDISPDVPVYTFKVKAKFPHDPKAYTQGLIFWGGLLFESTGLRGSSSLRQVDLETGQVIRQTVLPEPYFAEGIAMLDDKIFQLTWQERTVFLYSAESLQPVGSFSYETEGWGLTEDGQYLIMSDGTSTLRVRDPQDFRTISMLHVSSGEYGVGQLNELEYVEGEIWANIYQTSCIAQINPTTGRVTGWVDLSGMLSEEEMAAANVPNGIAYDHENKRLLVTGKLWPWLFEVEVLPVPND